MLQYFKECLKIDVPETKILEIIKEEEEDLYSMELHYRGQKIVIYAANYGPVKDEPLTFNKISQNW